MQNGGKRPGAGRPKGSGGKPQKKTIEKRIQEAEAREHMVNYFLADWDRIEATMKAVALGDIQVLDIKGKEIQVYNKAPDTKMLQTISETVIGRPKQEVAGSIDLPQLEGLTKDIRLILEKK